MIHLDHAAASILHPLAYEKMLEVLHAESKIGAYESQKLFQGELISVKENLAALMGSRSDQIYFFNSARDSWRAALEHSGLRDGDEIAVDLNEFLGNVPILREVIEKKKLNLKIVNLLHSSDLGKTTQLLTINWAPNNRNHLLDVKRICSVARAQRVKTLVDATQALGLISVSARDIGCDYLVANSRKYLRGPRGLGFLYSQKPLGLPEPWDFSLSQYLGFGVAVQEALRVNFNQASKRVHELCSQITEALPEHWIVSDSSHSLIQRYILIQHPEVESQKLVDVFKKHGLIVGKYRKADVSQFDSDFSEWVRISPHYDMTDEEVNSVVQKIKEVIHESK